MTSCFNPNILTLRAPHQLPSQSTLRLITDYQNQGAFLSDIVAQMMKDAPPSHAGCGEDDHGAGFFVQLFGFFDGGDEMDILGTEEIIFRAARLSLHLKNIPRNA